MAFADIRKQDVEDGLELMEVMAAERVMATDPEGTAARMRPHLAELERLIDQPDPARWLAAHRAFHFEVFSGLGPGLLQRTTGRLWHACERYILASLRGERPEQAHREHTAVHRCFCRRGRHRSSSDHSHARRARA